MWRNDKAEADRYLPAIRNVVQEVGLKIMSVQVEAASDEDDQHRASDYIIRVDVGDVACRIRYTDNCRWRELTLRSRRPFGTKTELAKLREGFARWYLYAWARRGHFDQFADWMWVDLDRLRASGLLEKRWREIWNHDRSSAFVAIPFDALRHAGAILNATMEVA